MQAGAAAQESATEAPLFKGHPATIYTFWQWMAVVFTVGIAYLYYLTKSMAIKYEITTQRVKIERGI
ncbi:MAG TPA: hypothetical protein VK832_14840, partial [Burkholderiaceae bacterium]|nr:hypothetical protein [Burkholderiaceae bacterium]